MCVTWCRCEPRDRALWPVRFLESPDNFSGPESGILIKIERIKTRPLFLLLTDSLDHIICKNIETSILDLNKSSFSALLIIGTFKKRYPLDV